MVVVIVAFVKIAELTEEFSLIVVVSFVPMLVPPGIWMRTIIFLESPKVMLPVSILPSLFVSVSRVPFAKRTAMVQLLADVVFTFKKSVNAWKLYTVKLNDTLRPAEPLADWFFGLMATISIGFAAYFFGKHQILGKFLPKNNHK